MSSDFEGVSLNSSPGTSMGSDSGGGRLLSANVRRLHRALTVLLSEAEREQFIHCLNVYHGRRNVFDLVQSLRVLLRSPSQRQLLPLLRLVIPRSDQLLFDQYTSEGPYLRPPDFQDPYRNVPTEYGAAPGAPARSPPLEYGTAASDPARTPPLEYTTSPSLMDALQAGEIRQVTLRRNRTNEGLGFSIRGGSEHGVGIYVSLVEPNSLAEQEGLRIGDQILRVNEKPLDKVSHGEAVRMPRKAAIDHHIIKEVLKSYPGIFTSDGELKFASDPVWREVCTHTSFQKKTSECEETTSVHYMVKPKQIHDYVFQDRHDLQTFLRQEFCISSSLLKADETDECLSSDSSSTNEETVDSSYMESQRNQPTQSWQIFLPYEQYLQIKPSTVMYKEGNCKKRRKVLRRTKWISIVSDALYKQHGIPCALSFKRNKVRISDDQTTRFISAVGHCIACSASVYVTAEQEPDPGNPLT